MTSRISDQKTARPIGLIVLDGLGLREETAGNAVALAQTPTLDRLRATCPAATLKTCGPDVGLPEGQMGNSEVGHMNLGAGRIVWMDLPKINKAMADGALAQNDALTAHINALLASGGACHLMGLCSSGGVHAHQAHIAYLAKTVAEAGVPVHLHLFTDGRDVPPQSALDDLARLRADLGDAAVTIATVSGRFFAMDRDTRWERVGKAQAAIIEAQGLRAPTAEAAVTSAYARAETDEFVQPTVIGDYAGAVDGDGLLMANFRSDRAREILDALAGPSFDAFARRAVNFAAKTGMVGYSDAHDVWMDTLFPSEPITNTLGEVVEKAGLSQFRLAETEKYPHVTFFFNGGAETPLSHENRHMEPSPKVATYDLQPEMSARGLTETLVACIHQDAHDLYVVNYANPDMVGHTGDLGAAIAAVEAVDACLGTVLDAVEQTGGAMVITADHGNCEMMIDPVTGGPHTAHTLNEVPVWLFGADHVGVTGLASGGRLADIAPTLLAMLGVAQPSEMTGRSLLIGGAA